MKITATGRGIPVHPNSIGSRKQAYKSAPVSKGADIFCFKGAAKAKRVMEIVSTGEPTELEKNIEKNLGITPVETTVKKFKNGEIYVNLGGNLRGKDVYLMPASGKNVNDNLMETYLKADAAKRAGAHSVIAVMPNFDYARQEKKTEPGEPIAAKLNMDLLKTSGVDEIITTDFHTPALEGFASNDLKIRHLESAQTMKDYIESKKIKDITIVSPDIGGTKRAEKLSKMLGCDKAIIYKHRSKHNEATAEDLIGHVEGRNCIIYDDIIDTAGTISEAAKMLKKHGAKDIYVCAAHGLFNGEAMQRLEAAPVKEVMVTNSVPGKENSIAKIKHVDISEQITGAMLDISG